MSNLILSKDILIIGFGAQAKAWALNLRDSGRDITIGLREGSTTHSKARDLGFNTINLNETLISEFKILINLTPDDKHGSILSEIKNLLTENQIIIYAHGFSVTYEKLNELYPKQHHVLLAPKAIASEVRFNYETKNPLTAVMSLEYVQDQNIKDQCAKLAMDLGINIGPISGSFLEETNADLFSEQSLLCSLIPYGARAAFEKLVEKNISPEIAYIECWHEVKLIADAMLKIGPSEFFKLISPNALLGGQLAKDKIISPNMLKTLDSIYADIENGNFFQTTKVSDFQRVQQDVINEWAKHPIQEQYDNIGTKLRPR